MGMYLLLNLPVQVLIDGRKLSCHDEIAKVADKKQGPNASAGSPIDFVMVA
jgi:hypothetical protein